ncbi:MAG: hypothetical protein MK105_17980, partial [Crocinitomicaceae bacterium]|nr:hypothetical protein [Crocinitomicaceae bacterium]
MKTLIFTILFQIFTVCTIFGQKNIGLAMISQPTNNVLLWNVENFLEFQGSEDFDSTWLYSKDCDFVGINAYSGNIIPRTSKQQCNVTIFGLKGKDTLRNSTFMFDIIRMPKPEIGLGSKFILKDLNNLEDSTLFFYRNFNANYRGY